MSVEKFRKCAETRGEGKNIPLTKEFRMDMARVEIPVSGWTCLRTGGEKH
jgi:hypothetical protein